MTEIRDALLRMVRTAMFLKKMAGAYSTIGLDDNPHHEAYGDLCDAIYSLVGEHVEEFDKSVTWIAVNAPFLTEDRRTELLMSAYEQNHIGQKDEPRQPKPHTFEREDTEKLRKKNGGYMAPEGDWQ